MGATLLASLALVFPVLTPAMQTPPSPNDTGSASPDRARIAGWYQLTPTHKLLVTWGPRGGYRLLDFDSVEFHRLEPTAPGRYRVTGRGGWETAAITVERDRGGRCVALRLAGADSTLRRLPRATEYPSDLEEVRLRNDTVELAGLLLIPRVRKLVGSTGSTLREVPLPLPGAVLVHGSGDSDRDNVWAFTFAQQLARAGGVTLFPDKRGSGASGGDWRSAGLEDLGRDGLAAVAILRGDSRVDPMRVGFVGLSQGGVVAALAAAQSKDVAFVVSVSAGAVTLFDQMRHEAIQDLRRAGVPEEGIETIAAVGALAIVYARTGADSSWSRYHAALEVLKGSPLAAAAGELPASRDDWRWLWWRKVGDVDPIPAWRQLDRPALAVFGEEDETDNVPVAESVRRLDEVLKPEWDPRHAVRVFPGLGHTLVDPGRGWVSQTVLTYLSDWVLEAVGGLDPGLPGQ